MTDLRSVILRAKRATFILKLNVFGYLPNCPKSTLESAAAGAIVTFFVAKIQTPCVQFENRKKNLGKKYVLFLA